jgi:UDP-N-acetylglucosamine 2-epimerase (non-hydrolysing)
MQSPFPEEANRRTAAPLMNLHFAPTTLSRQNLLDENIGADQVYITGNTVIDALFLEIEKQKTAEVQAEVDLALADALPENWRERPYVLITGHRRENFGGGFEQICDALARLARKFPDHQFIYPVHLNPNVQAPVNKLLAGLDNIHLIPPQGYRAFVALMANATLILTDSGGVQEEAPSLGKPVLVMRDTTERPEGVDAGTVKLVGADADAIVSEAGKLLLDQNAYNAMANAKNPYGDGHAAERIIEALNNYFQLVRSAA